MGVKDPHIMFVSARHYDCDVYSCTTSTFMNQNECYVYACRCRSVLMRLTSSYFQI